MIIKILKNGFEKNLLMPAKFGDVGYDMVSSSIKIVGVKFKGYEDKNDLESFYHEINYIEYDTGIALEPVFRDVIYGVPDTEWTIEEGMDISKYVQVKPRSSLCNYNLVLANHVATIDPNFRGTIKCRFKYIFSPSDLKVKYGFVGGKINQDRIYKVGDRVAQAVFAKVIHPEIEYVYKLSDSERKGGEFGSTGK